MTPSDQSPELQAQWVNALDEAIIAGSTPSIPPPPPAKPKPRRRFRDPVRDIELKLSADLQGFDHTLGGHKWHDQ